MANKYKSTDPLNLNDFYKSCEKIKNLEAFKVTMTLNNHGDKEVIQHWNIPVKIEYLKKAYAADGTNLNNGNIKIKNLLIDLK